jgi:AcrR family transcriptional regulator
MDIRERLLGAAAQVYAEAGYRGATTRRIAQQAGVSEITLFRQFGSKEALMLEALTAASRTAVLALPDEPADPVRELSEWSRGRFETLFSYGIEEALDGYVRMFLRAIGCEAGSVETRLP